VLFLIYLNVTTVFLIIIVSGLSIDNFEVLYDFVNPDGTNLQFWGRGGRKPMFSFRCQLAMTLWRLRRGITNQELALHFSVSEGTCHTHRRKIIVNFLVIFCLF